MNKVTIASTIIRPIVPRITNVIKFVKFVTRSSAKSGKTMKVHMGSFFNPKKANLSTMKDCTSMKNFVRYL